MFRFDSAFLFFGGGGGEGGSCFLASGFRRPSPAAQPLGGDRRPLEPGKGLLM